MNRDYVVKTCKTVRRHLEAIIASDGGYIKYYLRLNLLFLLPENFAHFELLDFFFFFGHKAEVRFRICSVFFDPPDIYT